jgi:obg-like ATPase 1
VTYLVNLSEKDYIRKKNKWCVFVPGIRGPNDPGRRLPKIKAWIDEHNAGDPLIPFSVALEERLGPLSAEEKEEEQKKAGAQSALGKITTAGYTSLDVGWNRFRVGVVCFDDWQLIRYFTCGPDEVRAWTIRRGTKAPQAAGVIQCVFLVLTVMLFTGWTQL